jgi:hypothetical protein
MPDTHACEQGTPPQHPPSPVQLADDADTGPKSSRKWVAIRFALKHRDKFWS